MDATKSDIVLRPSRFDTQQSMFRRQKSVPKVAFDLLLGAAQLHDWLIVDTCEVAGKIDSLNDQDD
jgi:hypothetical protein